MSLRAALRHQAGVCTSLGSPFTGRLLRLLSVRLQPGSALTDRLFAWPGDLGGAGQSVPLRLAGALHGLVLDGTAPDLAAAYPPDAGADQALWGAVAAALSNHAARIGRWLDRPPQTNEVGRSAVLIAAGHWLAADTGRPLVLSELGASAGLNLMWDRYALRVGAARFGPADAALTLAPDWAGALPPAAVPTVTGRRGVDLTPLDPRDPAQGLRLLAYLWPDQPARLARARAAIAVAGAPVDAGDAADWLGPRLAEARAGCCHLIFHTVAWQYFPPAVQARARARIERAGAAATAAAPVAWLGMETDGAEPGAALTLRLWPGDRRIALGRADFHGRWVDWRPAPVRPAP